MQYWIFKSEPGSYSIDDLKKDKQTYWDGVRNYQARNMLRDDVKNGDFIIFYHSSCDEPGAYGLAKVSKEGYPDYSAWDKKSEHPDPKSTKEKPIWYMVDIIFKSKFKNKITLKDMRSMPDFSGMRLLQRGNRLSLFPISKKHFDTIISSGK